MWRDAQVWGDLSAQGLAFRARIVLKAAEGMTKLRIAGRLETTRATVEQAQSRAATLDRGATDIDGEIRGLVDELSQSADRLRVATGDVSGGDGDRWPDERSPASSASRSLNILKSKAGAPPILSLLDGVPTGDDDP